jgi:hypothetical protein
MPGPADWRQLLAMLPLHTDRRELPPTMAGATAEAAAASSAAPASDEVAHGAGRAPLAALSPLEQARGTPTSPGPASAAVDLQDILDALAREIEREYRRFYGPA